MVLSVTFSTFGLDVADHITVHSLVPAVRHVESIIALLIPPEHCSLAASLADALVSHKAFDSQNL